MGTQSRVDILLALRTQLAGNDEALAYLDKFEAKAKTSAANVEAEMGELQKKISRKFSASDMGFDILKGVGFGSGFAVAETIVGKITEHFEKLAIAAKATEESTAKWLAHTKEQILLDQLPAQQAKTLEKDLADNARAALVIKNQAATEANLRKTAQILELEKRIAAYEAHGRGDTTTAQGYKKTLGTLKIQATTVGRSRTPEEEIKLAGLSDEALAIQSQLDAVKRNLLEAKVDNALTGFFLPLDQLSEANATNKAHELDILGEAAKKFGIDYYSLKEITPEATAQASASLKMWTDFQTKEGFATAVDHSNDSLRTYAERLNGITDNPFLNDVSKIALRVELLKKENAEIDEQIKLLKDFPDADPTAIRGQVRGLQDRQVGNIREINQPNMATGGVKDNLLAGMTQELDRLQTWPQNFARTITTTVGHAFDDVGQQVAQCAVQTGDWNNLLANVGQTIEMDLIGGLISMTVHWIEQQLIRAAFGEAMDAAALAKLAIMASAQSAILATPATLSTIASAGATAAAAPGEIAIASAITTAQSMIPGFSDGGFTGPGGIKRLHDDEWVAPKWMNSHPVYSPMIQMLESARTGGSITGAAASSTNMGSGSKDVRIIMLQETDHEGIARAMADPRFENRLMRKGRQDRGVVR